jgi:chromate transporter
VNVASVALMGVVTVELVPSAVVDLGTGLIASLAAVLSLGFRVNSTWVISGAALFGYFFVK